MSESGPLGPLVNWILDVCFSWKTLWHPSINPVIHLFFISRSNEVHKCEAFYWVNHMFVRPLYEVSQYVFMRPVFNCILAVCFSWKTLWHPLISPSVHLFFISRSNEVHKCEAFYWVNHMFVRPLYEVSQYVFMRPVFNCILGVCFSWKTLWHPLISPSVHLFFISRSNEVHKCEAFYWVNHVFVRPLYEVSQYVFMRPVFNCILGVCFSWKTLWHPLISPSVHLFFISRSNEVHKCEAFYWVNHVFVRPLYEVSQYVFMRQFWWGLQL